MTRSLEMSVKRLAGALDALEQRLETRFNELGSTADAIDAARLKAQVAKSQASAAAEDLADAICDLKSLLAEQTVG